MSRPTRITSLKVQDIRFPTSLESDGSDAIHPDPDYSSVYVTLLTDCHGVSGVGTSFTVGRGNEIVCEMVRSLAPLVVGLPLQQLFGDFAGFWRKLTSDGQIRWIGPEKGVVHLATAAIVNALWDLWAKIEGKPLWKLLSDMSPEQLVSTIDFRYLSDVLTKEEALQMLKAMESGRGEREAEMRKNGYPAYTTAAGWLGYSNDKIKTLCNKFMAKGWDTFKIKVGQDLDDDKRRLQIMRDTIGWERTLMVDANQKWDVPQAISWMKELSHFKLKWIEEPTSPDDVLGHAAISKALKPLGIGVATGEMCQNRVMFKQFLQAGAMQYCQIDACRMGGVNEVVAVYLMANKFKVPVCPHAGGVGLCEQVQHLQMFDFICVSGSKNDRIIEYVDHLERHYKTPAIIHRNCYMPPTAPGYGSELLPQSLEDHEFPSGSIWQQLFREGKIKDQTELRRLALATN